MAGILAGTNVSFETTIPFVRGSFNVQEEVDSPTGLFTKLFRPRVVITTNGVPLVAPIQPGGDPRPYQHVGFIVIAALAVLLFIWWNE